MKRQATKRSAPFASGAARAAKGMTLVELLVSALILAMMIGFISDMLVRARDSVRLAQAKMKANADIRALANQLRTDVACMDPRGLLAILVDNNGKYHVVMTTTGSFRSFCNGTVGANAARVHLCLSHSARVDTKGTSDIRDDVAYRILCRQATLLDPTVPDDVTYTGPKDYENASACWYHVPVSFVGDGPIETLAGYLYYFDPIYKYPLNLHPAPPPDLFPVMTNPSEPVLPVPPATVADIDALWPFMMSEVTDLRIQWTDGQTHEVETADGGQEKVLNWYDADNARSDQSWKAIWASTIDTNPLSSEPEFNLGDGLYCALWAPGNRTARPRALRIALTVSKTAQQYEIIVDMPD